MIQARVIDRASATSTPRFGTRGVDSELVSAHASRVRSLAREGTAGAMMAGAAGARGAAFTAAPQASVTCAPDHSGAARPA